MLQKLSFTFFSFLLFATFSVSSNAQSVTSGDVAGTITDPTGAEIPHAAVTLTNVNTNATAKTTSSADGTYRFVFLPPGTYKLNVSATGFQSAQRNGIAVSAGQPTAANIQLQVASATQAITVTEAPPVLQTENADVSTNYNAETILNLPNPGGDISYIAQTAPGVVMNTQAGLPPACSDRSWAPTARPGFSKSKESFDSDRYFTLTSALSRRIRGLSLYLHGDRAARCGSEHDIYGYFSDRGRRWHAYIHLP